MEITMIGMAPVATTFFPAHRHEEWEILYFFEGSGFVNVSGKDYEFNPGTIMLVPPLIHSERSEMGFRDIFLSVKGLVLPFQDPASIVSVFQDTLQNDIGHLMNLSYRIYQKKEHNWEKSVHALFDGVYQILIGWAPNNGNTNLVVEHFKNALIQNLTNHDFDLGETMTNSGFSKDHLRKVFKASTGYTPLEYLTNLRVEYALKLISQRKGSGFSLKEICYLSGFADPYYFSRVIKTKTGKCPTDWSK